MPCWGFRLAVLSDGWTPLRLKYTAPLMGVNQPPQGAFVREFNILYVP